MSSEVVYRSLYDLVVPNLFIKTPPSRDKFINKLNLIKSGYDQVITININNIIFNGYASYLAYKSLKTELVPCVVTDNTYNTVNSSSYNLNSIYIQENSTCYICKRKLPKKDMSVDHVVPQCKGGLSTRDNLRLCCKECNSLKASFTYSDALVKVIRLELRERGIL